MLQKAKKSGADDKAEDKQDEQDGAGAMEQDEDDEKPLLAMVGLHAAAQHCPCVGTAVCVCVSVCVHLLCNPLLISTQAAWV